MIGIKNVGVYIPDNRINNLNKASIYGVDIGFIKKKIGIAMVSRKKNSEMPSDLCVSAFKSLYDQEETDLNIGNIDFLCVCTDAQFSTFLLDVLAILTLSLLQRTLWRQIY
jgi:3-hydroxy-3-methylglutaryl CoA synthase